MRALTIFLGVILLTLSTTEVSAMPMGRMPASEGKTYSCRIITGYGTAIGQGSSKLKAKEVARELCGEKMIDGYIAQRGEIPDDVVGDLSVACINKECE